MESITGSILLAFLCTMLTAPLVISLLYRYRIVRREEGDFSHIVGERYLKAGTPIMGGVMIIFTVTLLTLLFNHSLTALMAIIILLISSLLGAVDDIMNIYGQKRAVRTISKHLAIARVHRSRVKRLLYWIALPWAVYKNVWYALGSYPGSGIHAGEKIIIQSIVGGLAAWWIYIVMGWSSVWFPIIGFIEIGWLMPPLVLFLVLSMTNAVNISDGMDGLSSGMLIPPLFAFLVIALDQGNSEISTLISVIIGATLAYIYFNIKPARVEMGDAGTLALGAVMAFIALTLRVEALLPVICGMFILEIGSSLVQGIYRKLVGRRLLKMAPLHLHFQIVGWSEEKTVMRFWLFSTIFSVVGLWLYSI